MAFQWLFTAFAALFQRLVHDDAILDAEGVVRQASHDPGTHLTGLRPL